MLRNLFSYINNQLYIKRLKTTNNLVYQEAKSEISHDHDIINENEADELLKPYLLALATDIKNGKEKVIDSEEFFNELKKS